MKKNIFGAMLILFLSLALSATEEQNKSALSPSVISIPDGPGSIEGLGESFEPQLNSGTGSHRIALNVPPGRAGFQPSLSLNYNTGSAAGVLGQGWSMTLPMIKRKTDKGLPVYTPWPNLDLIDNDLDGELDEYDEFDILQDETGEELVPISATEFRAENETSFRRYRISGDGWEITNPNGVKITLGLDAAHQITSDTGDIYSWLIASMIDLNGNSITFNWTSLDGTRQKYLSSIIYNQLASNSMSVSFDYQSRDDVIDDFRPGFRLTTLQCMTTVSMWQNSQLVRRYDLNYQSITDLSPVSLLASVTQFGADGVTSLPAAEFTYTQFSDTAAVLKLFDNVPAANLLSTDVDFIDINGDGLPDILDTSVSPHAVIINNGSVNGVDVFWSDPYTMASSPSYSLSSNDVQLADFNGDAHSEMLKKDGTSSYLFAIDNGVWQQTATFIDSNYPAAAVGVRMLDVNGDRLTDFIQGDVGNYSIWLNQGNKWSAPYTVTPTQELLSRGADGVRLADMNGDSLVDIVNILGCSSICQVSYYPNQGYGQFGAVVQSAFIPMNSQNLGQIRLTDVNGDGRSDLMRVNGSVVSYWINKGVDKTNLQLLKFSQAFTATGPTLVGATAFREVDINANGSTDLIWYRQGLGADSWSFLEFNPTEQPYQLKSFSNGIGATTTLNYASLSSEMIRDNGTSDEWNTKVPIAMQLVKQIAVTDGYSSNTYTTEMLYRDGYYDSTEREFRGFAQAQRFDIGDDAQGAPTLTTEFEFDLGIVSEVLKGKPLMVETRNQTGDVFNRFENTWLTKQVATPLNTDARSITYGYQSRSDQHFIEKGNDTPVLVRTEFDYDNYGNQILLHEYGRIEDLDNSGIIGDSQQDLNAWDDERITTSLFSSNYATGQSIWLINLPIQQQISDRNAVVVSKSQQYYDDDSFAGNNLGEVSKGNLSLAKQWFNPANANDFIQSERKHYDQWGNVTAIYDPLWVTAANNHYREIAYDSDYQTFPITETIHTGNSDAAESDPTLIFTATYDKGFGKMLTSTEFNGHTSSYVYDEFARLTDIVKPYDSLAFPTVSYEYTLIEYIGSGRSINWVGTKQRETAGGGTVDSRKYHDGLGRPIMTRSEGESVGQVVVTEAVNFNQRKQNWKKYLPYFDTGTLAYKDPDFSGGFQEYVYDAQSRPIKVYQPEDTLGMRVFSETIYQPLSELMHDEEQTDSNSIHFGAGKRLIKDGLFDKDGKGRLRQVQEMVKIDDVGEITPDIRTWTTSYSYNVLDDITGYTDAQNNQKFIYYDGLKRKTFMNDPDRSWYWWAYDAASNVVRTRDAKDQEIAYAYDGSNRLTGEWYATPAENTGNTLLEAQTFITPGDVPLRTADVIYHYDYSAGHLPRSQFWQPITQQTITDSIIHESIYSTALDINNDANINALDLSAVVPLQQPLTGTINASNVLGQLSYVEDLSGEEHRSYDNRMRMNWMVKRIKQSDNKQLSFYTEMDYDSMDREVRHSYPDETLINYQYNTRGLMESVANVVMAMDYNPAGQNLLMQLSNGVTTSYSYDYRLRLDRLSSLRSSDSLLLQDLNYSYDGVSNILDITDARNNTILDAIGTELGLSNIQSRQYNASQSFIYDSIYRLTQAKNQTIYGQIDYRYDRIGNMVDKTASLLETDLEMNLGTMTNGGISGATARLGRSPNTAPGPHALTGTTLGPDGAMVFDYDNNGNMHNERGNTLTWDHKDRLSQFTSPSNQANYLYDYNNTRKTKTVTNTTTGKQDNVFYIDKYSELRNGQLNKYAYVGSARIARMDNFIDTTNPNQFQPDNFYLHDHLGSTNLSTDSAGQVKLQMVNYPYGHKRKSADLRMLDYNFTGKETDIESGLQYFEARYYSSVNGAFVSVDLLFFENTDMCIDSNMECNTYSYVKNNPIIHFDETGQNAITSIGLGIRNIFNIDIAIEYAKKGELAAQKKYGNNNYRKIEGSIYGGLAGLFGIESEKDSIDSQLSGKKETNQVGIEEPSSNVEIKEEESFFDNIKNSLDQIFYPASSLADDIADDFTELNEEK